MSSLLSTNSFVYKTPLTMYTHKRRILPRTTKHLFCTVVLRFLRLLAIYSLVSEKLVTLPNPNHNNLHLHDTCTQSPFYPSSWSSLSCSLIRFALFIPPSCTFMTLCHYTFHTQESAKHAKVQTHTPGLIHAPCSTNAALSLFARILVTGGGLWRGRNEGRKEWMSSSFVAFIYNYIA